MTNTKSFLGRTLATLAGATALTLTAADARACGGFFCSRTPVDQTAERIIFTINDDETVTTYIQIAYQGDRDDFAWVVPVPGEVDPEEFPQRSMTALDLATEPMYSTSSCSDFVLEAATAPPSAAGGAGAVEDNGGVMVLQEQNFGPFASVTITGDDAEELVAWLQDNGYRILDTMVPYIEKYVEDGMAFFAMRLLPDADVTDISPVKLTYAGSEPMIPIRLTTIAAQPEMGIVTWVLANEKYAPKNYADLPIADELIEFDFSNYSQRNNYLSVVSREVDRAGGHAFVTEYAQPTGPLADTVEQGFVPPNIEGAQEAQEQLVALLRSRPYITRLYSRMSAEEMTADPFFEPASEAGDVENQHFLQCDEGTTVACECDDGAAGVRTCGAPDYGWYGGCVCDDTATPEENPDAFCPVIQPPSPCAFTYCGRAGACVPNDAAAPVCVCADGATARPRTTTAGELQLYCEPLEFNFQVLPDVVDPEALEFPDACDGFDCGANGSCTSMNGTATCECDAGYGATVASVGGVAQVTCEAVVGVMPSMPLLPEIGDITDPQLPMAMNGTTGDGSGTSTGSATTGDGTATTTPGEATPGGEMPPGAAIATGSSASGTDVREGEPAAGATGGCSVGRAPRLAGNGALGLLGAALVVGWRRRRRP